MLTSMPTRYVRSLLRLLPEEQRAGFVLEVGLDQTELEGDGCVTLEQYAKVFALLITQLQTVLHGDNAGPIEQYSSYRQVLESMVQAPDLARALDRAAACFRRLSADHSSIELGVKRSRAYLVFEEREERIDDWTAEDFDRDAFFPQPPGIIGHASLLWIWHRLTSWLIGRYIALDAVELRDQKPVSAQKYSKLFDAQIKYQQNQAALVFPKRYLDYPIVQTAESVDRLLEVFLLPLFMIDQLDNSTTSQVKGLIGSDFSRPIPTFNEVAARLNTSVPTLHRRLQKEETSYQNIKDDCRKMVAVDLLLYSDLSNSMVAERLGFSDDGTFHRAFRKWTGQTPTEFRKSQ